MRAWALMAILAVTACAKKETVVTPTVAQRPLTAAEIDADPLALLPTGFVGIVRAEIPVVAKSALGPGILAIANRLAPLPQSSGFVLERDVDRIVVGLYSMQGADAAGLATGRFNPDAIQSAAASTAATSGGFVQSPYAGYLLYTVHNIGFCVLTQRTLLFGNETGMRRALDRVRDGRAMHEMPDWTNALLDSSRAPLAFGGNLEANPLPATATQQVPFLAGLHAIRVLGNFESPGVNLAGSMGYETPERAAQAAQEMLASRDRLKSYGWIMNLVGVTQPIQRLEAQTTDREVSFVTALDGAATAKIMTIITPTILSAVSTTGQ